MRRFTGTVEHLGPVGIASVLTWLSAIPWSAWPQQTPIDAGLRPAMVNTPDWHGFYAETMGVVKQCQGYVPRFTRPGQRLLSVVMPGHAIPPHVDTHSPRWWGRVHVPLTSDQASRFMVGGESHHLDVGTAYAVNTLAEHSVSNEGGTVPRVHLMVD